MRKYWDEEDLDLILLMHGTCFGTRLRDASRLGCGAWGFSCKRLEGNLSKTDIKHLYLPSKKNSFFTIIFIHPFNRLSR